MRRLSFCLTFIVAFFLPSIVAAMSVTPIVLDMEAAGQKSRAQLRVANTGVGDIPVAITVNEVVLNEEGTPEYTIADDDFVIFPFQAIIPAGGTQVFRLQYVGDPDLEKSKSYIFSVVQQPVDLPEGVSGIQILYNFEVVGSVAPLGGKADLTYLASDFMTREEKRRDEDGNDLVEQKRRVTLEVENPTNTHAYLSGSILEFTARNDDGSVAWKETYRPQDLAQTVGIGLVQPEMKRRFILPFDVPEGGTSIETSIRYVGRP